MQSNPAPTAKLRLSPQLAVTRIYDLAHAEGVMRIIIN